MHCSSRCEYGGYYGYPDPWQNTDSEETTQESPQIKFGNLTYEEIPSDISSLIDGQIYTQRSFVFSYNDDYWQKVKYQNNLLLLLNPYV